jgi:hypothetical protein
VQQAPEQVRPALVAHAEPAAAEQPRQAPLHDPPVSAQALARLHAAPRDPRRDPAGTQGPTLLRGVVRLVGMELGRSLPRPPRPAAWADDRRDGVDDGLQKLRVVDVRGGERTASGIPFRSTTRWYLLPRFPRSTGLGPVSAPPRLARTLTLSRLARDQSIAPSSPSQFRSVECSCSQTPAACQSRSRRQHVVPLPHPDSRGKSRHGVPVRRMKTMPVRAARSGTRGRPPFGFGRSLGRSGSIASQRSSDTRGRDITVGHHASDTGFCNTL